jgi:hypothetical protein
MFVKIENVNYYVNSENKTAIEIFYEVFSRMNVESVSTDQKIQIIENIKEQLKNEMFRGNEYRPV